MPAEHSRISDARSVFRPVYLWWMQDPRIEQFLAELSTVDGSVPLSDAKVGGLGGSGRFVTIEEADDVVAVGVAVLHAHGDGAEHWAVETALLPGLRFAAFEDRLLALALNLVPAGESCSVWAHRTSLEGSLDRAGFVATRELAHYFVAVPLSLSGGEIATRPYRPDDLQGLLGINRRAFAHHREAASLDAEELEQMMRLEWFDPDGLLVAEEEGDLVAFCWTRVHPNGEGEIYRVAVAPVAQGRGLGRSMVVAGFDDLARRRHVRRGTLWVDLADERALLLYESLGMTRGSINREFVRLAGSSR